MFGPALYQAFRSIKRTFDPDGMFNPGKIVDAPPLTSNLRYGAGYMTPRPATFFDYSDYGGMGGAVEMCSGLGACRKTLDGTMCPSYMATRDEAHSTRGRANVLRLAMAGRLGESGLGDEGVNEVLDLCLECRACKAECPVGVDVARFKSEFLADYWKRHGTPLRARMLGHIHELSRWGSRFAPALELGRAKRARRDGSTSGCSASIAAACRRRGPRRRSRPASRAKSLQVPRATPTFIFNDTFTNYYNPGVGMAGARRARRRPASRRRSRRMSAAAGR